MESLTQEESITSHVPNMNIPESQSMLETSAKGNLCAEDLMDNEAFFEKNIEGDDPEWQAPKPRKVKKPKKVVMETRTSSRIPRDGIPIAAKATQKDSLYYFE